MTGNVIVECPRIGLVRAALCDVSLGGMCVETQAVTIPLNAPISVVFDLESDEQREGYCLQAMVVRHTERGAGIMFLEPDAQVLRSMRDVLYGGLLNETRMPMPRSSAIR